MHRGPVNAGESLSKFGVRPTRQRLTLASLVLSGKHGPATAESLYAEARAAGYAVSRSTVSLALRHFEQAGLIRRFTLPGSRKAWFDAMRSTDTA